MFCCSVHAAYKQKQQQEGMSGTDRLTSTRKVDKSRLAFHIDQGATDLIALLSISAAPQGGESKWVSAVAIHNELLRRGRQVIRLSSDNMSVCQSTCMQPKLCPHREPVIITAKAAFLLH